MATASPILEHRDHDHKRCAADALGHAEELSRREGLRFTTQRREVLQATLFLICDNCGAAGEAPSETLGRIVADETKRSAFMPRLRVLEIRGLCARCRAA